MEISRRKGTVFSREREENYKDYIGAEPKVVDVNDPKQLLLYIAYQQKRIEWLEKLSKSKGSRADRLKSRIVDYAKMEDDHIPLLITESDLEKIAYMKANKRTRKESDVLDVLNVYLKARTHQSLPIVKDLGVNEFHLDILVLLYTYESLKFSEFLKVIEYRKKISARVLASYYLRPLEAMGLTKAIRINPKVPYSTSVFMLTELGRTKIEQFAKYILNDKLHPIKIYEHYSKRKTDNENTLWKDFGFPIRPVGKEEAPTDRRRRVRNREQV